MLFLMGWLNDLWVCFFPGLAQGTGQLQNRQITWDSVIYEIPGMWVVAVSDFFCSIFSFRILLWPQLLLLLATSLSTETEATKRGDGQSVRSWQTDVLRGRGKGDMKKRGSEGKRVTIGCAGQASTWHQQMWRRLKQLVALLVGTAEDR